MNLGQAGGKVPIEVGGDSPWLLIEWPSRDVFDALWSSRTPPANIEKVLGDAGSPQGRGETERGWGEILSQSGEGPGD
jgi:hypothetical protein